MFSNVKQSLSGWTALLRHILICRDVNDKNALIEKMINRKGMCVLSFVNAQGFNVSWSDKGFLKSLLESEILLRDGIGVHLLMRLLKLEPGLNLNGTDFIPELLDRLPRDEFISIYGTIDPCLEEVKDNLESVGFRHVHTENGFHENEFYVSRFQEQLPSVVLLAMGMPKQEAISVLLRKQIVDRSVLIINGGAIIDFMSKRTPRAPILIRNMGMEWGYRLIKEPRRLWRRNLGNFIFIIRGILMRILQNS